MYNSHNNRHNLQTHNLKHYLLKDKIKSHKHSLYLVLWKLTVTKRFLREQEVSL